MELRCAAWARIEGVDPVGTAGSYAGFCCIEWRRPWPRDLSEVETLASVSEVATRRGFRLQGLLPVCDDGHTLMIAYRAEPGTGFTAYRRVEVEVTQEDVSAAFLALLDGAPAPPELPPVTDVLVCTHGRRDVCCGSRGTALLADIGGADALGPGVRLWATSHTGGHRFAPTAIVLPQGTLWAFLDADRLHRVVHRKGPVDDLLPHYRGCAGLRSPAQQALERAVLGVVGWELFDCRRTGSDLGGDRARLDVTWPDGSWCSWEAEVMTRRLLPVPDCGCPVTEVRKQEAELAITGLRQTRSFTC